MRKITEYFTIEEDVLTIYSGDEFQTVVPKGVKTISRLAFFEKKVLNEVILPKGLKKIETGAFTDCSNLHTVVIPRSVKYIEKDAFKECPCITLQIKRCRKRKGWAKNWNRGCFMVEYEKFFLLKWIEMIRTLRFGITFDGFMKRERKRWKNYNKRK